MPLHHAVEGAQAVGIEGGRGLVEKQDGGVGKHGHGEAQTLRSMALEDTVCLLTRRQDFFALLERHPSLVRSLLLGLTRRLVELTNRLAELTGGHVEPRFSRLFLKLADQMGTPAPQGVFIPLPLSRQELADLTGTTVETCIRIMSRWGKEDLVETAKEGFILLDRQALEALSRE